MTSGPVYACVSLCLALFLNPGVYGQSSSSADSATIPVNEYFSAIGGNSYLYNGPEYVTLDPSISGSPFFRSDSMSPGRIIYNGGEFRNVPMLYDLYSGKVVINRYGQHFRISLVPEKLSSFEVYNHHFVLLGRDSLNRSPAEPGIFDRIYEGRSTVFVKRIKLNESKIEYNVVTQTFRERDFYFIKTGGRFYPVNSRAAMLSVFGSKKSAVKKFIRKNKLNYKKRPEETLIRATAFFDQTTP